MMWRRLILAMSLMLGVAFFGPMTQPAQACPMCKIANEQDALLPTAYMYSILFMMGMIFSLGGGVGLCVFFISRKENAAMEALGMFSDGSTEPNPNHAFSGATPVSTT